MGDVVGAEKYALSDPNDKSEYQSLSSITTTPSTSAWRVPLPFLTR